MKIYEKWYAIEPLKGYVLNADFTLIKSIIKNNIDLDVEFIKKRDFILIVFTNKKPMFLSISNIFNLLKYHRFKKAYEIKRLGNERTINYVDEISLTIGVPY